MDKQHISDNKFYIILVIALLALVIGIIGLIIGLQGPPAQTLPYGGSTQTIQQLPPGAVDHPEIDSSTSQGVVESPKKN